MTEQRGGAKRASHGRASRSRAILEAVLLGVGYFALAWVSVEITPYAGGIAYVWPAGGVALATLLLAPRRHWPHILAAVFAANTLNAVTGGHSLLVAVLFALPNVLVSGGSAWLLLRLSGRPPQLASVRGVLVFTLVAAVGTNALAAALGAAVPHFFYGHAFLTEWRVWWISEALGVMLMAPLILAWSTARLRQWPRLSAARVLEALAVAAGTAVTAQIAFGGSPGPSGAVVPYTHLVAPFLVWAALRFHIRGATSVLAVATIVAGWNTALGNGPFAAALGPGAEAVLHLQGYLALITAMALLVAAVVRERALLDAQLREAQKLEALGAMAGGIAHDFNNILGAILGFGEMAAERAPKDPRLREPLAAILDAGRRGKALVDQILTVSRRQPLRRDSIEPAAVLCEVRDLLAGSVPEGVTVRLRSPDENVHVIGDATRLHQLIMNLATNAVQAMEQGGELELSLDTRRIDAPLALSHGRLGPGDYAVIGVSDTGSGIAPEVMERIFEPFFSTKGPGRGTGLGLSLVYAIAKEMSGAIDVTSHVGRGALFEVYVPVTRQAAERETVALPADVPRASAQTVLVVDDDRLMLLLAEELLAELGCEPVGYDSPQQALAAFEAQPQRFDAALVDERMPGMSGIELATRIRALRPDLAVIVVTGYAGPDLDQRAHAAGVARVIAKPYTARMLEEGLRAALRTASPA
jgi:signal transduction histidine kinase/ActR/RegA family two-component response regulator